jgi:hypothetical protein
MSCPDWKALAAWRDDSRAEEPAEWRDALAHFDRGCSLCRRAALAADPTLVFRRLAAVPEPTPLQEASDVESMRRAVAAMRAASRVEEVERRASRTINWTRWAAAAALAVVALSMPGDDAHFRRTPAGDLMSVATLAAPAVLSLDGPEAVPLPAASQAASVEDLPSVEGVNRPGARVYHMDGEGMSVVMIVDESLDV